MLNFNEMNKKEEAMYLISIGNHTVKMSESDTQTIINAIVEMGYSFTETKQAKSQPKSEKKSQPLQESPKDESAKKTAKKHLEQLKINASGTKCFESDTCTVVYTDDAKYRLYITTPIKAVRYAIKCSAKECGCKYTGDYSDKNTKGEVHWTFNDEFAADKFIKAQMERA